MAKESITFLKEGFNRFFSEQKKDLEGRLNSSILSDKGRNAVMLHFNFEQ